MVVIFRNNRGRSETLSPGRLRKNLAQLVGEQDFNDVENLDVDEIAGSNQLLATFFSKLNLSSATVDSSDVERSLRGMGLTDDKIQIVFAMSRPHFLAVVYLIVSGRIGAGEISELYDLQESSRTDVLLGMIPSAGLEETILSRAFDNAIRGLFSTAGRESLPFDAEYFKPNKSSGTVVNLQFEMVPDAFYLTYNTYLNRIYGGSEPGGWPLNRIHEKWVPNAGNSRSKAVTIEDSGAYIHWNSKVRGIDPRYPTFYSFLKSRSFDTGISGLPKVLRMNLLHSFALNSYLPMAAIKAYRQRNSNQVREWEGFPAERYAAEAVKRGIWFATPADATDTYLPDYFVLAHFLYHNSDNIGTENKGLDYWDTFIYNSSPGSSLRSLEASVEEDAWSFSYVEDDSIRQFLAELFPASSAASERGTANYLPELLLSRTGFNSIYPGATVSTFGTSPSRISYSKKALIRADQISKFDIRVADDKRVISMGPQQAMGFVSDSFKIALESAAYSNQDLLAVDSESEMSDYINGTGSTEGIKDAVVSAILAQSGSTPGSQGYNRLISDSNANVLNRFFVAELAGQFFDYLTDPEQDEFEPYLSDEAMSVFRLLNFVKHTFINFGRFFDSVAGSGYYNEFLYMILISRFGLDKDTFYEATKSGSASISTSDIKAILPAANSVQTTS